MIAARKYRRVVQVGIQSRARRTCTPRENTEVRQLGRNPARAVYNLMEHPLTPLGPAGAVPAGFDYDLWCGPAALLPYHPDRRWLNYAEFSCGPIPGDAVHQLDLARFLLDDPAARHLVSHQGGIEVLRDGRDTPDTQVATFDLGSVRLHFEGALWMPYMKKTDMAVRDRDTFPNWPFSSTKLKCSAREPRIAPGTSRRRVAGVRRESTTHRRSAWSPGRPVAHSQFPRLHPHP